MTQCGADVFPGHLYRSLGYWTSARTKTLKTIALKSMTFFETTLNQALQNLSEQLSVKLCEYNAWIDVGVKISNIIKIYTITSN